MQFSQDWFTYHIVNWKKWLHHFKVQPIRALEIGCFEGRATCWLLENILINVQSTMDVVDTFKGSMELAGIDFSKVLATFRANTAPHRDRITEYIADSKIQIPQLTGPYDLVYMDGSHRSADTLVDALNIWPKVARGGIVIFDDYEWKFSDNKFNTPRMAIDVFLEWYKEEFELISKGYQVCIKKR